MFSLVRKSSTIVSMYSHTTPRNSLSAHFLTIVLFEQVQTQSLKPKKDMAFAYKLSLTLTNTNYN